LEISDREIIYAIDIGNYKIVKYFVEEKGVKISDNHVAAAKDSGHKYMVDYLNSVKADFIQDEIRKRINFR
jgi:hypothetical protein